MTITDAQRKPSAQTDVKKTNLSPVYVLIVLVQYEFPVLYKRSGREEHRAGNSSGHSRYQLEKYGGSGVWQNAGEVQNRRDMLLGRMHNNVCLSVVYATTMVGVHRGFDYLKALPLLSSLCVNISWINIEISGHFHTDNNRESR